MFRYLKLLYVQVLIAVCFGVWLGYAYPSLGAECKPLGDAFIKLIKMILAPLVFCTVALGIAGMQDMKKVGKIGLKALVYFEIVTTLALILGLLIANTMTPGHGMHIDIKSLDIHAITSYTEAAKHQSTTDFLLHIIPSTFVAAFAKGELLQILLLAILTGTSLVLFPVNTKPVTELLEAASHCLFGIVHLIMKVAPLGAFGAMAFTIGKYGIDSLSSLGMLMLSFYATCLLFIFGVLGVIAWLAGFRITRLIRYLKEELLLVLGTSSSESALPRLMMKLEQAGCHKSVVGLVVPTGYSFNLDGTCIYFTMAALFIAQATDVPLTLIQQFTILAVLLLTSKGAAGVTGSGFITLAATLASIGTIPVEGLALILGIDRFMSEARALTNFIGNAVATIVIAKWEKALDKKALEEQLA